MLYNIVPTNTPATVKMAAKLNMIHAVLKLGKPVTSKV